MRGADSLNWVGAEGVNILLMNGKESDDFRACAIADTQPDKLGRMTVKQAALVEIRVLGNERKTVASRVFHMSSSGNPFSSQSRT